MTEDVDTDHEVLMEVTNTYEVVQGVFHICLEAILYVVFKMA